MVALNVGLEGTTFEAALAAVVPLFERAAILRTVAPTGEDTLVIYGESATPNILPGVYAAAETLNQDCIAVDWPLSTPYWSGGVLWGPRAYKWVPFVASKFVYPPAWMRCI